MGNDPDWKGIVETLAEDVRRNREARDELGERIHTRLGSYTRLVRGAETGCYVTITKPGLRWWQRIWAHYAFRGIRWAAIPLLPFALTGGEVFSLLCWALLIGAAAALVPWKGATVVLIILGVLLAVPVAVLPAQKMRARATRWTSLVWSPGPRGPAHELVNAICKWPKGWGLPVEYQARLYQLACWTTGTDTQADAVVPEMVNLIRSVRTEDPPPLGSQRSLEDLLEANRIQRKEGAEATLHAIEALLQHRSRRRNDGGPGGVFAGLAADAGLLDEIDRIVRRRGD